MDWYRSGIPLERAERAILLGCLRKYVTLINHGSGTPITTLGYFRDSVLEGYRIAEERYMAEEGREDEVAAVEEAEAEEPDQEQATAAAGE